MMSISIATARLRVSPAPPYNEVMVSPLVRELLVWLSSRPRTYEEAMEAWRSSCPRHTVWEDASIEGLIEVKQSRVELTALGRSVLDAESANPAPPTPI